MVVNPANDECFPESWVIGFARTTEDAEDGRTTAHDRTEESA